MAAKRVTAEYELMDDLLTRLGGVSPKRVLEIPTPGTATVGDVADAPCR